MAAISARGRMHFMDFTESFDARVMCRFLDRIAGHFDRKIHPIVDRHSVHRSKTARVWLAGHKDKIELHFLPPHSPRAEPGQARQRRPHTQPAPHPQGPEPGRTNTAWRHVNHTNEQPAVHAPSLTEALTSHHPNGYLLLDDTVAETDRVQAPGHFSGKARREDVNLQVITAQEGRLLWLSPAVPGSTHDITAARHYGIVEASAEPGLDVLSDKGYQGAGAAP